MTPALPMPAPDTGFGPALRRERERRGISLDAIAKATKVSSALLASLEEDDLSRWPSGIFRRAFVKGYAEAIGLDANRVLADFLQHFPDQGTTGSNQLLLPDISLPLEGSLRLTLEETAPAGMLGRILLRVPARAMAIALDMTLLIAIAAAAGALWGSGAFWVVLGSLSVFYQLVTAIRPNLSPGNRLFDRQPRPSSSESSDEEASIQASLQLTQAWSERLRKNHDDSTPKL